LTAAKQALARSDALLSEPCLSHCHLLFYRDAIEVSLQGQAWTEALSYAARLEDYVSGQPLPCATLLIERALPRCDRFGQTDRSMLLSQ